MNNPRWHKNDALFKRELTTGRRWEVYVAEQLTRAGIPGVSSPEYGFRKSIRDAHKFKDQMDIIVGESFGIEVKSRTFAFTGLEDVPAFAWPHFIMSTSSWEGYTRKPSVIVSVSQKTGGMIVISALTRPHWIRVPSFDRTRGISDVWLAADKEHWRSFEDLVSALKREVAA